MTATRKSTRKVRKPLTAEQQEARKEQRAARVAALNTAAEQFEFDDENVAMIVAYAALTEHYSENNALLILAQAELLGLPVHGLQDVGAFGAWQERGRTVRKGEHQSIFIWAPAGTSADADKEEEVTTTQDGQKIRHYFKVAGLFHVSQTDELSKEEEEK